MALFDIPSNPDDANATVTLYALLKAMRAKVTQATVQKSLEQHPDFPSVLSLSDVLTDWQVEHVALQLNTPQQLRELPLPFVAHVKNNNGWYVLVTALQGDRITYTDSEEGQIHAGRVHVGRKTESLVDFARKWSGSVLLAEATAQSGEADYDVSHKQEIIAGLRGPFAVGCTLLLFLFALLRVAKELTAPDWLLLLSKSIGLTISILLVAKQLGSKNAFTDRLCRMNSKTSCDGILNAPAAKLWGWLSWTDVGLIYFSGGLLTVLLVDTYPAIRPIINGLALLALPYTVFSVYYQARILRQWCPLCLGVQGVLLVEGVLAAMQFASLPDFIQPYLLVLTAYLVPTLIWVVGKPLFVALRTSRQEHNELMYLKRNPDLFRAMVVQQPQMPTIPENLHPIVLGNPDAEHTITMVTNPYCGPCAKTHKELEQLLRRNDNVKAAIIFADGADSRATQVAIHAVALAQQGNAQQALTDWYEQPGKNFDAWAEQYPIRSKPTDWQSVVQQHSDWCQMADIKATPTLYVDGYLLPEQYRFDRLRWLINELEPVHNEQKISL